MREETLTNKIIIFLILFIPIIICIIFEYRYKNLEYDVGEFTGYTLEIKRYK